MVVSTDTSERRDVVYKISENIAEKADADICELPALYETIDPDALGAFLQLSNSTDTDPERSVEFSYCGYRVTVDSTSQVHLHPEPERTPSRRTT